MLAASSRRVAVSSVNRTNGPKAFFMLPAARHTLRSSSSVRTRSRARSRGLVRAMPRTIGERNSVRTACQLNTLRI